METSITDPFKEAINEHLNDVAYNDPLFLETLKKPNKSLDGCIKYIYSEVQKAKRCGWKDDEIFAMAIHYYDDDNIQEVRTVSRPLVSRTEETTAKVQKKAPKTEPKTAYIQTSLEL